MVAVQLVDINRIVLDTENPRIKHFMEMYDQVTDVAMKLALAPVVIPTMRLPLKTSTANSSVQLRKRAASFSPSY